MRHAQAKARSVLNTLVLPLKETDDAVLSVLEGEVLGTGVIDDLLRLVDTGAAAVHDGLVADRDRLQTEVDRLVASIAAGVPPQTVAPLIRTKEAECARLEVRLRAPRPETPDLDHSEPHWSSGRRSGDPTCGRDRRWRGWSSGD